VNNVAQGMISTAHGIGAAFSTTLAGLVVVNVGYSAAFLTLAAVAAAGLALFPGLRSRSRVTLARRRLTLGSQTTGNME
jgi:dipeptide/tripeptide permease